MMTTRKTATSRPTAAATNCQTGWCSVGQVATGSGGAPVIYMTTLTFQHTAAKYALLR